MSDWSYLLGNVHQAIEALLSDKPQAERIGTACTHIVKTPQAFLDAVLSKSSKESLATITSADDTDAEQYRQKIQALGAFIVSAVQDTAEQHRRTNAGE